MWQDNEISPNEFESLVDVFRTLLEWERESESDKGKDHGSNHHQSGFGLSSDRRILAARASSSEQEICVPEETTSGKSLHLPGKCIKIQTAKDIR